MFMSGMGHGIDVAQYLTVPEGRALRATNSTMLKAVDKNRDLYKEVFYVYTGRPTFQTKFFESGLSVNNDEIAIQYCINKYEGTVVQGTFYTLRKRFVVSKTPLIGDQLEGLEFIGTRPTLHVGINRIYKYDKKNDKHKGETISFPDFKTMDRYLETCQNDIIVNDGANEYFVTQKYFAGEGHAKKICTSSRFRNKKTKSKKRRSRSRRSRR
jgi:hypothetical protein